MMRLLIAANAFIFALLLASCSGNSGSNNTGDPVKKDSTVCYTYHDTKDTVQLEITVTDSIVTGNLTYNYFEKDKNSGTISGKLKGELIVADYTFFSEGISSVRQVAFRRSGEFISEGYGSVIEKNGKTVFISLDSLDFDHSHMLKRSTCND